MSPFVTDARGVLQCEAFLEWRWLDHGFSTRHSADWLEGLRLASLKQIHSSVVLRADSTGIQGEADALVTAAAGLHVAVRTADCFPILLLDPRHRAVAAVHSGWRGTAGQIVAAAALRLADEYGSDIGELHAAIGPGIAKCCFEVGPEVAVEFGLEGRAHVDLPGHIAAQLTGLGIPVGHVHTSGLCTACQTDLFWSYRRQRESAGRMWSGAAVLER